MAGSWHDTRRDRRLHRQQASRRRRVTILVCALSLGTTGTALTSAVLVDSSAVANTVSTGAVILGLTPTAHIYTVALAPGEAFTTPITVTNSGSIPLRYAVNGKSDSVDANFIASRLRFQAKTGVTTCTTAGFPATGSSIAGPTLAANTTGIRLVGDPAQGAQGGDRSLAAGQSEVLCVQVAMPTDQRGPIGGRASTVTYTFTAEQTASNP